jgi:hypothetical protein
MLDILEELGSLDAGNIVSVDGINFNPDDNHAKYGRALRGHEAVVLQITIDGISYAVMAAMSDRGFIAWTIYDSSVCGENVAEFLRYKVIPRMTE